MTEGGTQHVATSNREYSVALARAFAGAVVFCLPLLMTMEMWWLGIYLEPWRIIQLAVANIILLYGLSHVAGFEESHHWADDLLDSFAAYFVAAVAAAGILFLIGAIRPAMTAGEIAGMVTVQTVPASFGAMIGAKLMGEGERIEEREHWRCTYPGQLFLMLAGALFLSFTVAPTEEVMLISFQMTPWHALAIILLSILALHAILYFVGFTGQAERIERSGSIGLLRHTLPGYAIAVLACLYILWSFGRLDGLSIDAAAMSVTVLAMPASVGAAIARIVI